jgi:predicted ATPase/DNA-binding XRE family transcriptional regulator
MLRRLRIAANLSQEELAEAAKMSVAAIGAYERGVRTAPYRESIDLLADAFGLLGDERQGFLAAARPKSRLRGSPERLVTAQTVANGALPREPSAFVGREAEIRVICDLLSEQRLLTITGSGGVGKTRVALEAAARLRRPDGVWFVDLGSVRDPGRLVAKIVSVVAVPSIGGDERPEALAQALSSRSLLLVMDNCEHVLAALGQIVSAVVRNAPGVSILATSRQRLNVSSEYVFRLSPLPIPEESTLSADAARKYAAVELFASRAGAVDQQFLLTDDRVSAVTEICRRVEGIPLALELAAARLPMFGLNQLMDKLSDRLGPLKVQIRDAPERQQTLRATIDWSYDLLADSERLLLKRIAVFAGGCTLDSAEEVCSDEQLAREIVSDALSSLVDQSLVMADTRSSITRYSLFESTRQYALEKLANPEHQSILERHAEWCATFADQVYAATHELTHNEWAEMVLPDFDNMYQAIDWAAEHNELLFARMAGSMYWLWWRVGRLEEGRQFAVEALSLIDERAHPLVAARLHLAQSVSLASDKKIEAARRAITLLESVGEPFGLVEAYMHLGGGYLMMQDLEGLRPVVERAADLVPRTGESILWPLISWLRAGVHSLEGDLAEARLELIGAYHGPHIVEHEADYEIGALLAAIEYSLGNVTRAAAICDELAAAARQQRMVNHEMHALVRSSGYHLLLGNIDRAGTAARDALLESRGINATILTQAIELLATVGALRGDPTRAALLYGYVDAWFSREEHNHTFMPAACRELLIVTLERLLTSSEKVRLIEAGALLGESAAIAVAMSR